MQSSVDTPSSRGAAIPVLRPFPAILLLLLFCAFARPCYAADKWLSVRSKNFLVIGNANEPDIRRIGRYLEEFRSAFAMMFPKVDQASSVPTTIVVFKNDESFAPYKPVDDGKPANAAAYFQPGEDVNFLTRDASGPLPIWAREGLAECYSTFELNGRQNEFTLGRALETHIATFTGKPLLPLKTLFAVDSSSPYYNETEKQGIFYAESWALTHYLMLGAEGKRRSQFVQFLMSLGKGDPVEDSFAEAFQTDYGENFLESVYQAAVVRRDEIHIIHREYFGFGESWFGQFGMLSFPWQVETDGPEVLSREAQVNLCRFRRAMA